ncbi:mxaD protein [Filomicrobium insigne]|uniref:MxaD protein n=1 Tax=Filomicrobium insigne TaxID=418854 RepID=A0A1H0T2E0_9HYPH|nr:mxaD protein [Filomicrobium insigne]
MMRWSLLLLGALTCLGPLAASAHGPTPQKVEEKIVLKSSPADVWAVVSDFGGIVNWHPGVETAEATGGNKPGAERTLTLKSGGVIVDGLDEYNAEEMSYGYRLSKENIEALPVSFYSATLSVKPGDGGGSEVVWLGRFYRADTSNFPPENLNDQAAVKAMETFFREGLEGLKAKVAAGK